MNGGIRVEQQQDDYYMRDEERLRLAKSVFSYYSFQKIILSCFLWSLHSDRT
jgi:hypothetical protein